MTGVRFVCYHANVKDNKKTLGSEIRILRLKAQYGLREFAKRVSKPGITLSAAHLSDIEHDRRKPSEGLLKAIVENLKNVGADLTELKKLDDRLPAEILEYTKHDTEVREILYETYRRFRDSNKSTSEVLADVLRDFMRDKGQTKK